MSILEARKGELEASLADAPRDVPHRLPATSAIYAKKVEALGEGAERRRRTRRGRRKRCGC